MFHFLTPIICPKCFYFLCIGYYNHFSLLTSIYLVIKSTLIISEKTDLLELIDPLLVSLDLNSFRFNSLRYFLFYFWFSSLFQFLPLLQIILVFFLHLLTLIFLPSFSLPRFLLSSLS